MESKETILQLYENYIDEIYTMSTEKMDISGEIADLEEEFEKTLSDEQKEVLKEINDKENSKNEIVYKQIFVFAYSLANKLMIESLSGNSKIKN